MASSAVVWGWYEGSKAVTDPGFSLIKEVQVPAEVKDAADSVVLDKKSGKSSVRPEDKGETGRRACGRKERFLLAIFSSIAESSVSED